jgi:hypothetical protein
VEGAGVEGEGKALKDGSHDYDYEGCNASIPLHYEAMGLCKMAF